eukprot:scaffold196267_cov32-Tisochrysis_lutea.AAC.4
MRPLLIPQASGRGSYGRDAITGRDGSSLEVLSDNEDSFRESDGAWCTCTLLHVSRDAVMRPAVTGHRMQHLVLLTSS